MRLFLSYIYQFRRSAVLFLTFTAIFLLIFFIYDIEPEPVGYAFVICVLIGIVSIMIGFFRFRKKHLTLAQIYENLPLMTDSLPDPDNDTERSFDDIITRLTDLNRENVTRLKEIQQNNSEYFTVWVHQIKTPISAVQMILQQEDSSTNREILAEFFKIEQYAEMALNYIRLDSDTNDFVIKRYNVDHIIRQAIRRYAPLFIRKKLSIDYQPANGEVLTDEKWLGFVVEQLLSNAVKYTSKGSVTVKFQDNILSVSDTGMGISPEDLPRVFEKGYTGMSGRTNKKSTGLGLYLCKMVCDKLGHRLTASSQVGQGSVFSVDLTVHELPLE